MAWSKDMGNIHRLKKQQHGFIRTKVNSPVYTNSKCITRQMTEEEKIKYGLIKS